MKVSSSCGVEIRKQNICFRKTTAVYQEACSYLVGVLDSVWEELVRIEAPLRRFNEAEHLVHTTKKNQARFDFDLRFPKMPSYLRRSAIQFALGAVSSYRTRLAMWEKGAKDPGGKGSISGKPVLQTRNHTIRAEKGVFPESRCCRPGTIPCRYSTGM